MGKILQENYVTGYIGTATERLQKVAPDGLKLSNQDVFAMQLLCAYETAYIGNSEFCQIFTEEEWASFDRSWEIMCM